MPKNAYSLSFNMKLQPSRRLLVGKLVAIKNGKPSKSWRSTSSLPGRQYRYSWRERGGVLPPDEPYQVETTPIYMPQVRGVEGNFFRILPFEIQTVGDLRGDFGVHADRSVPGTLGCVGILEDLSPDPWDEFWMMMKVIAGEGIKTIPLDVSYTY
jgi:hypothetical protein